MTTPDRPPGPAVAREAEGEASRLVATLEAVWASIRRRHEDVPAAVLIIASGSDGRGAVRKLGHFAAGRWQVTGSDRAEVLVSGEGLQRGAIDVLGTLLHESAHGVAFTRRIVDTSRQGRYHNRRYQALAGELGLDVAERAPFGWASTTVPPSTGERYAGEIEQLDRALVLWRRAERTLPGRVRSGNGLACACECGRRIRVAPSTLEGPAIICGACEQPFQPLTRTRQPRRPAVARTRPRPGRVVRDSRDDQERDR